MFCPNVQKSPLPCPTNRLIGQSECHMGSSIG
jgi:hypothetical protein